MAFCTSCGKAIPDGLGYCPHCTQAEPSDTERQRNALIGASLIGVIIILLAVVLNICIIKGFFGSGSDGFDYETQPVEVTTTQQSS